MPSDHDFNKALRRAASDLRNDADLSLVHRGAIAALDLHHNARRNKLAPEVLMQIFELLQLRALDLASAADLGADSSIERPAAVALHVLRALTAWTERLSATSYYALFITVKGDECVCVCDVRVSALCVSRTS